MRLAAALLLLAGGAAAEPAPLGLGPVTLGMGREAAVAAAGPDGFLAPLCGQPEGLVFPDAATPLGAAEPATVMAMFAAGRVSEMDAALDGLAGSEAELGTCLARGAALAERLGQRHGGALGPAVNNDTSQLVERRRSLALPTGEVAALARWYPSTGRCFTHARWLAVGATPVIP